MIIGDRSLQLSEAFPIRCAPYKGESNDWVDLTLPCERVLSDLRRLAAQGIDYAAFAWPSFAWIETGLQQLDIISSHFDCLRRSDDVFIVRLAEGM